jgi:hypothetical protein
MRSRQRFPGCRIAVNPRQSPVLVTPALPQSRKIFQLVQAAGEGSERGFVQVFECRIKAHVTFLERGNYFSNLFKIALPNTLSRGNSTLERNLTL